MSYRIQVAEGSPGMARRLVLSGQLELAAAGPVRLALDEALEHGAAEVDLAGVERIDGGVAAVLAGRARSGLLSVLGTPGHLQPVLDLYLARSAGETRRRVLDPGLLETLGRWARGTLLDQRRVLEFLGDLGRSTLLALRAPSSVRWRDVTRLMDRHGSDGLPINALIGFLMGLITAFQAALQLHKFGADIFVADLVGLSLTRELGPLMTGIVLAGRSGAAIAAELGTMKVGEEVDALRVMGLDPVRFLVLPRMLAVTLIAPLLAILSTAIGIVGGAMVANLMLDIPFVAYRNSLEQAVGFADVFSGVGKAVVFGLLVAAIACQRGLATRGGAEGVGRATTSAVVTTLFTLIVVDAGFTVLYDLWGI